MASPKEFWPDLFSRIVQRNEDILQIYEKDPGREIYHSRFTQTYDGAWKRLARSLHLKLFFQYLPVVKNIEVGELILVVDEKAKNLWFKGRIE